MKLQIRKKEVWHTMLDFDAAQRFEVEDAAASLSRAAGGLPLRMLDDDGTVRHLNSDGAFRNEQHSFVAGLGTEAELSCDPHDPATGEKIAQWLYRNGMRETAFLVRSQLDMRNPLLVAQPSPQAPNDAKWRQIETFIRNEDYEALEKMDRDERELKDAEPIAKGGS